VEELLKKSFAAFQLSRKKKGKESGGKDGHRLLVREFERHLLFLKETGYVDENNRLTDDGVWASQLRVDQPLLIAEGFRRGSFPETDAALLAAIIAAFVNEQETDDRIEEGGVALSLLKTLQDVWKDLRPFVRKMAKRGFETRSLYLRPAATIHNWATGLPWKKTVEMSEIAEGNLCMLILRTADHLRHIRALHKVFPQAAQTAATAIDLILKEPVSTYYEL
jgi:superfamily II RNA helicase